MTAALLMAAIVISEGTAAPGNDLPNLNFVMHKDGLLDLSACTGLTGNEPVFKPELPRRHEPLVIKMDRPLLAFIPRGLFRKSRAITRR